MPIQLDFTLAPAGRDGRRPTRRSATTSRGRPRYERDYAWLGARDGQALPRRRHRPEAADGRRPAAFAATDRGRSTRPTSARSSTTAQHPTLGAAVSRRAATSRWSSCCATSRPTASPPTSPRAATATSCARRRRAVRHPAGAGDRQLARARLPRERRRQRRRCTRPRWTSSTTGPTKPVRIWSRIGRRPIVAVGNSNGDIPMLRFARGPARPALRLLLLHDDADREFDYTAGAEEALGHAPPTATGRSSASRTTGPRSLPTPASAVAAQRSPGSAPSSDAAPSAE